MKTFVKEWLEGKQPEEEPKVEWPSWLVKEPITLKGEWIEEGKEMTMTIEKEYVEKVLRAKYYPGTSFSGLDAFEKALEEAQADVKGRLGFDPKETE